MSECRTTAGGKKLKAGSGGHPVAADLTDGRAAVHGVITDHCVKARGKLLSQQRHPALPPPPHPPLRCLREAGAGVLAQALPGLKEDLAELLVGKGGCRGVGVKVQPRGLWGVGGGGAGGEGDRRQQETAADGWGLRKGSTAG